MYDYEGSFDRFDRELKRNGITTEEFDIYNFVGLTYEELKKMVAYQISKKNGGKK